MTRSRVPVLLAVAIAALLALASLQAARSDDPSPGTPAGTPTPTETPTTPTPTSEAATPSPRASISTAACGSRGGKEFRYRLEVERGLATTKSEFASVVRSVLCDGRGWTKSGHVRFRYDPNGKYKISLLSARSTERRCSKYIGYPAGTYYSCAGITEAVLNADRWFGGSKYWPGPRGEYRRMLVNHEVGHVLDMRHRYCPGSGKPAPVMQQQSKGLKGCVRNPWPTRAELHALPYGR
jgi:hypothetical protein